MGNDTKETFELQITGFNGHAAHCVYINNYRLVGSKPWGGGSVTATWNFTLRELQAAFPELEIRLRKHAKDDGAQHV